MTKKMILFGLLTLIAFSGKSQTPKVPFNDKMPHDWENQAVSEINREPVHASLMPFDTEAKVAANDFSVSPFHKSLNGKWKFHFVNKPADRPTGFFSSSFDDSQWKLIDVPANWNGKDIILHFGAVSSAIYVWVNGEEVGYSEDSKTPAEFNITKYLKSGKNLLAVQVFRWCDGSYLEDQDFWRMSGITRDVYLVARAATHVFDFQLKSGLDEFYNCLLYTSDAADEEDS